MVLLDVSGSMNFDPIRPIYNQYLITGYTPSIQPKNKGLSSAPTSLLPSTETYHFPPSATDVAKAIVRRFSDALSHHDHSKSGYDLVTFSSSATYIGKLKHSDFDQTWSRVRVGGGTRVMTGWQKCKELHFNKHRDTSTWHPTLFVLFIYFALGNQTAADVFLTQWLASWSRYTNAATSSIIRWGGDRQSVFPV